MWADTLDRDVGDRIHRVIAACVADPSTPLSDHLVKLLGERPVRGARAASVRMRVASSTGTYLRRFAPGAAVLVGCELPVGGGVADLVWRHDGRFAVDEIKSGSVDIDDEQLVAQVARFITGGRAMWGDRFVGVRVVPLARPARSMFVVDVVDDVLVSGPVPHWLGVR